MNEAAGIVGEVLAGRQRTRAVTMALARINDGEEPVPWKVKDILAKEIGIGQDHR